MSTCCLSIQGYGTWAHGSGTDTPGPGTHSCEWVIAAWVPAIELPLENLAHTETEGKKESSKKWWRCNNIVINNFKLHTRLVVFEPIMSIVSSSQSSSRKIVFGKDNRVWILTCRGHFCCDRSSMAYQASFSWIRNLAVPRGRHLWIRCLSHISTITWVIIEILALSLAENGVIFGHLEILSFYSQINLSSTCIC